MASIRGTPMRKVEASYIHDVINVCFRYLRQKRRLRHGIRRAVGSKGGGGSRATREHCWLLTRVLEVSQSRCDVRKPILAKSCHAVTFLTLHSFLPLLGVHFFSRSDFVGMPICNRHLDLNFNYLPRADEDTCSVRRGRFRNDVPVTAMWS